MAADPDLVDPLLDMKRRLQELENRVGALTSQMETMEQLTHHHIKMLEVTAPLLVRELASGRFSLREARKGFEDLITGMGYAASSLNLALRRLHDRDIHDRDIQTRARLDKRRKARLKAQRAAKKG